MNILVTGSNGQLGNELRNITDNSKNRYVFTDIEELDITDLKAVRKAITERGINAVVNLAAYTNVDKAEGDCKSADLINNRAVGNLAAACKEADATLIHISTDYVFNGCKGIPYREDDTTGPLNVYGQTKLAGETAIRGSGCKHIIFRTSWLYSEYGNNFVKTMLKLSSEQDTLNVVFDQIGTPTYAKDLARVIYDIIENDKLGEQGTYHFSNEGVCSWYDFAKEIAGLSGSVCDIRPCHSDEFPSKAVRPHFSVLDKTKVKETFGIRIPHWKESLAACLKTFL